MIEPEQVDTFRREGVALLRGVLSAEEVDHLAQGVERNLGDLGPLGMNATPAGGPGAFVEDFRNWQRIPQYCIDGRRTVSFWIPLDPVERPSSLEFVAGSHAEGTWFTPRSFVEKTAMVFDEGRWRRSRTSTRTAMRGRSSAGRCNPATRSPSTC